MGSKKEEELEGNDFALVYMILNYNGNLLREMTDTRAGAEKVQGEPRTSCARKKGSAQKWVVTNVSRTRELT